MRHRPIGIGVQGLADTFILLGMPFDSPERGDDARHVRPLVWRVGVAIFAVRESFACKETLDKHKRSPRLVAGDLMACSSNSYQAEVALVLHNVSTHLSGTLRSQDRTDIITSSESEQKQLVAVRRFRWGKDECKVSTLVLLNHALHFAATESWSWSWLTESLLEVTGTLPQVSLLQTKLVNT